MELPMLVILRVLVLVGANASANKNTPPTTAINAVMTTTRIIFFWRDKLMLSSNKTASSAVTCNQVQLNTRTDGRREKGVVCGGLEWPRVTRW
jgi:hypothetical protein